MYINDEQFHEDPFEQIRSFVPSTIIPYSNHLRKGTTYFVYARMLYLLGEELTNYFFIRLLQDVIHSRNLRPDVDGDLSLHDWVDAGSVDALGGIEYSRFDYLKTLLRALLEKEPQGYSPDVIEQIKDTLIKEIYK